MNTSNLSRERENIFPKENNKMTIQVSDWQNVSAMFQMPQRILRKYKDFLMSMRKTLKQIEH